MRLIPILVLFVLCSCSKDESNDLECLVRIDGTFELMTITKAAVFIDGGEENFNHLFAQELKYPSEARENGIEGLVSVSFVIEADGSTSTFQIEKDIGFGCGELLKHSLEKITKGVSFYPAELEGEPIAVKKTYHADFKLE